MQNKGAQKNISELMKQSKAASLFQFIRELNKLKQKAIVNIKDYPWHFTVSSIPEDPENIKIFYRDRVEEDDEIEVGNSGNTILSVHKPEFQKCPEPDNVFKSWLLHGWEDYRQNSMVKKYVELSSKQGEKIPSFSGDVPEKPEITEREYFDDDVERVQRYKSWEKSRAIWAEKQELIEQTRSFFSHLYRLYFELQREAETEEIIVADGILRDASNPEICHPILTHRVKIEYDADSNTVSIADTDTPSELYSTVFQVMDDVNLTGIKALQEDLQKNDYHPLDRNDTPIFLKILVHQLSANSLFSKQPIALDEKNHSRLLLYLSPCFIVRKRLDGTLKAIERIIEDIQETGKVPKPISDIILGGTIEIPEDTGDGSIEERLAAVGGESVDILFSKEANNEQLEIAKRIENYNAVLVQGPPGTGKTHTIANLMGHFLAQGKNVLVTSYTKKALRVLKEKVAYGMQELCVSMLDDSNVDMERSIDGITKYTSQATSFELKREMESLATERKEVIRKLAEVRKKIYAIIYQECNSIILNGENISPSKAAAFVADHENDLSYIPGKVRLYEPLPLSFEQLSKLYRSNEDVTAEDEKELAAELPDPKDIMTPDKFSIVWEELQRNIRRIENIQNKNSWKIKADRNEQTICFSGSFGEFVMPYPESEAIRNLKKHVLSFGKFDSWMKAVIVDGKRGNAYRQQWLTLRDKISRVCACADEFVSLSLGKQLILGDTISTDTAKIVFTEMKSIFAEKAKISKFTLRFHKNYEQALSAVTINGKAPASAEDCELVLKYIELQETRQNCRDVWDNLLVANGVSSFDDLDRTTPERIAANWIELIEKYLNWYSTDYKFIIDKLVSLKIPTDVIFRRNIMDSELVAMEKIFECLEQVIPQICDACDAIIEVENYSAFLDTQKVILTSGKRCNSSICNSLISTICDGDIAEYANSYSMLEKMHNKYALQAARNEALKILEPVAPQWAEAIRIRQGVHGECMVPNNIDDAWKWKQLCGIIEDIIQKPFAELQADSLRLSREYRNVTAKYAEKSAWYHLLLRTESNISMKQALEGWRLTVKSIGKGTGKRAPMLKAKARELMVECQKAVPCWIMPINKALESLDPRVNKFDIIIIDEASQADISSLAILYMGDKLIIVGDDQQVSPMAVGVEIDKINSLQEQYIKDKIPNAHLYTAKTSIYDVAKTTFQPLMLREHFRCVPEIIGFSNMLSYDGKIKPLRDASSSKLLPAVVNYRVDGGERVNKTNYQEADAIVALMRACFEQPEYNGKTFGVISLLGDDQVKLIQQKIESEIEPQVIIERNILCGNSANFQGDERDVIFLSIVDSGNGCGPLHMMNYGVDNATRKRYNVAASRARDQLWVIDSLDSTNDLKSGDIRKILIDYSLNPNVVELIHAAIEKEADSPFEISIATALSDRGYHIVQQWKVGSYRLDIVVVCGNKKVAIECDGEKWHSGEEKIREDMERQTILERLGWKFIRIRGSEFYRNSEKTIERVINELSDYSIMPESTFEIHNEDRETELLKRVKIRAHIILKGNDLADPIQEQATIATALNPKSLMGDIDLHKSVEICSQLSKNKIDTTKPLLKSGTVQMDAQTEEFADSKNEEGATFETLPQLVNKQTICTEEGYSTPKSNEKRMYSKATHSLKTPDKKLEPMPRQLSIFEMAEENKKILKQTGEPDFINELKTHEIEFIDNREQSNIVWIIFDEDKREFVENVIIKYNYRATLEKRGAIATKNKPAWRVMIQGM